MSINKNHVLKKQKTNQSDLSKASINSKIVHFEKAMCGEVTLRQLLAILRPEAVVKRWPHILTLIKAH